MTFDQYIGIDYSGAKAASSRLAALQVYIAVPGAEPKRVEAPCAGRHNWCRRELAHWLLEQLRDNGRSIIGIDHGMSFPMSYMLRNNLSSWDEFLAHFHELWPTDRDHMYVDFVREQEPPSGSATELRLCESWTAGAKSVFHFDVQGSVAKSTHAGLPWIRFIRDELQPRGVLHCWPFDGFEIPERKSVIAEMYPSILRRRFASSERTADQQDAFSIAAWLKQMDSRGMLHQYFNPPLSLPERRRAALEGWILGVY